MPLPSTHATAIITAAMINGFKNPVFDCGGLFLSCISLSSFIHFNAYPRQAFREALLQKLQKLFPDFAA